MRAAGQSDHVLHRPAPAERGPAQAQRVRHKEAVRVRLVSAAPEAVVHRGTGRGGRHGAAVERAGRGPDGLRRGRRRRRRRNRGRRRRRFRLGRRRRRRAQRQARADVHIRGGHSGHGPAGQPARRPGLHRRLHHVVQQGGELSDAQRVREQPDSRDAGDHGPEGPPVVVGQTGGRGHAQGRQVASGGRAQQQAHHGHRRGFRVTRHPSRPHYYYYSYV